MGFFQHIIFVIIFISSEASFALANYNLQCSSNNFDYKIKNEMTINNIFVDIPENKNVVTFDGKNYVTSFDETFTLVANRNNRRIILDKLEGTIFLEEKFNDKFTILEIYYCQGFVQDKT